MHPFSSLKRKRGREEVKERKRRRERDRSGERYFCIQGWLVPGRDSKIFLESKAGWARNVEELPQVGDNLLLFARPVNMIF